jgi:hypothetical protein
MADATTKLKCAAVWFDHAAALTKLGEFSEAVVAFGRAVDKVCEISAEELPHGLIGAIGRG